ncbi:MAG: protein kinase [Planctomycetes bacterium]|nr:protein kinase [Planctomycetota bacterium]
MPQEDRLFGEIALSNNMITEEMLEECLRYQEDVDPAKVIGQILLEKGYLSSEQIDLVLKIQNTARSAQDRKVKEQIAEDEQLVQHILERSFATREEIDECVHLQQKTRKNSGKLVPLGELLLRKKYITHSHLDVVRNLLSGGEFPQVSGYKIIAKLSKGGMGYLYKARQISMDRIVALKVLDPKLCRNETHVRRFQREAQTVAKLNHENIVAGIDVGDCDGRHYFVMEYINGESVLDVIKREERLSVPQALDIAWQTAEALEYAAKHGIIHRDVKPSNILINHRGTAKICDLGFAKSVGEEEDAHLTIEGLTLGTPYYMSPEQAKGQRDLDFRTDIYALGATLYHMLFGRVPFTGRTSSEVMKKHLSEPLSFPEDALERLSPGAVELVKRMMEKDREKRVPNYGELLDMMRPLLGGANTRRLMLGAGAAGARPAARGPAAESIPPKVLILCHTRTGATTTEGQWIAEGAMEEGAMVKVDGIEAVDVEQLVEYDCLVVGAPSYFGSAAHEIKAFFEKTEQILGQLDGKIGAAFISRENIAIGRDRALFDIIAPMLYHGMLVRGDFNFLFNHNPSIEAAKKLYEQNCRKLGKRLATLVKERKRVTT